MKVNKTVNNNPTTNRPQSGDNMGEFPIVLKRAILDWESEMREQLQNPYFDAYEELSSLVGLSVASIRKYTNQFNPEYPTVLSLIRLCKYVGNRPIEFINDYSKKI